MIVPYACETLRKNKQIPRFSDVEFSSFSDYMFSQRCYGNTATEDKQNISNRIKKGIGATSYLQDAFIHEGDIRELSSQFIEENTQQDIFMLAGGPPCQPFSKAGKRKSVDDPANGDLFFEYVRLVKELRPRWFIFENVKGLTQTKTDILYMKCSECQSKTIAPFSFRKEMDKERNVPPCVDCKSQDVSWCTKQKRGGSLDIIINEFESIGYKVSHSVLNAADFGAPQRRERLFIVGSRDSEAFSFPKPTHGKSREQKRTTQRTLFQGEHSPKEAWVTMRDALWPEGHPKYGKIGNEGVLWVKNVVRPHDEPVTWELDRPSPTIGAHQAAKLAFAPYGVPDEQLARQQWHTLGQRQGDTPPVDFEHTYLSDEDLLRLQTFPSYWYLHGTRMQRAFQIGNAVPPILGYVVGKAVLDHSLATTPVR